MRSNRVERKDLLMRTRQFHWTIDIAASMICILVTIAPVSAKSKVNDQNTAVSGTVTGNVQEVGFRAMIQKQAIQYNLAGSAENNTDGSVRFTLQGDNVRIKQALKTISKGTKKSSNVSVIPALRDDPKLVGRDDTKVVGDSVAKAVPFFGNSSPEEAQDCRFEL